MRVLTDALIDFGLFEQFRVKTNSLMDTEHVFIIAALPDGQWITELASWQANTLAALQIMVPDYALGPQGRVGGDDLATVKPSTDAEKKLCGMQKMRKSGDFV